MSSCSGWNAGRRARAPVRSGRCTWPRCRAFSLLESLVVLALVCSLAMFAWPMLTDAVRRFRVEWTAHALVGAIGYARAEAVRRGASTTVCRSDAQDRCSTQPLTCDGRMVSGHDWRCGWVVVAGHRAERGGARDLPVLRRFSAPRGVAVIASRNVQRLTFRAPSGVAPGKAGSFEVRADGAAGERAGVTGGARSTRLHRCLLVGMSGRVRVHEAACAPGRT
ncbi:MAG: GspH/FimT family pseudopilin [Janthinobacterium lividum]